MNSITSVFRNDINNIGDYACAPHKYFDFSDFPVSISDIQDISQTGRNNINNSHIILGGGGLLVDYYQNAINQISALNNRKKLIAWGVGQQLYNGGSSAWWNEYRNFPYNKYLDGFDLVGIRDYGFDYNWLPCVSCMHPSFDKKREIKHEFVVFSHKRYPIPISGIPKMDNNCNDINSILDFLGSGDTIITSSFHGMYWGVLLNRKVLAFPTTSKFLTLKHPVTLYPAIWSNPKTIREKIVRIISKNQNHYICKNVKGWRILASSTRHFPEALEECRYKNQQFYKKVCNIL